MPQLEERTAEKETVPQPVPKSEPREMAERYLAWLAATRYSGASIKSYGTDVKWFLRYLEAQGIERIADVTAQMLADYSICLRNQGNTFHKDSKISLSHVSHRLFAIKQFFGWLAEQMIILADPSADLDFPRRPITLPRTILTQQEAQRLVDAPDMKTPAGYCDKALLEVVYSTGIRSSELVRLKVSDFDPKNRTLYVKEGKWGKDRILPLPVISAGYMKEYIARVRPKFTKTLKCENGILFLTWTGSPLYPDGLTKIFKRTSKAAGIDKRVTCMVLRHSIASHLLENGMDIRYIQEFMGHENLRTTQIYSKVTLDGLRKRYNKAHPEEKRGRGKMLA